MSSDELTTVNRFTVRQAAMARIFEQLHRQTHVGLGKYSHPRCKLCREEFDPEKLEADTTTRRRLGLL